MLVQENPECLSLSRTPGSAFPLKPIPISAVFSRLQPSSAMRCSALLLLTSWGVLVSVSGSPAVEEAYRAVVELVSPGQPQLTADSLRSLFNRLENRVQCGEVSCEKVSFIRLTSAQVLSEGR